MFCHLHRNLLLFGIVAIVDCCELFVGHCVIVIIKRFCTFLIVAENANSKWHTIVWWWIATAACVSDYFPISREIDSGSEMTVYWLMARMLTKIINRYSLTKRDTQFRPEVVHPVLFACRTFKWIASTNKWAPRTSRASGAAYKTASWNLIYRSPRDESL